MLTVIELWYRFVTRAGRWSFVLFLKDTWLLFLFLAVLLSAFATLLILAYPFLSNLAARYFQ